MSNSSAAFILHQTILILFKWRICCTLTLNESSHIIKNPNTFFWFIMMYEYKCRSPKGGDILGLLRKLKCVFCSFLKRQPIVVSPKTQASLQIIKIIFYPDATEYSQLHQWVGGGGDLLCSDYKLSSTDLCIHSGKTQHYNISGARTISSISVLAVAMAEQSCALNSSNCSWKMMLSTINLYTDSGRSAKITK